MKRLPRHPIASFLTVLVTAVPLLAALVLVADVRADKPAPAVAGKPAPAAAPAAPVNCKAYPGQPCCDPAIAAHLSKESIYSACRQSESTFQGERGSKDTCRYIFKTGADESFIEVYAPAQKEVPSEPNDPFFVWRKVGKVFVTDKAASPKSAPMLARATGLWMPGKGFSVSVNVSTKICGKPDALKLARKIK